ncbi:MAG TPA: TonB-dependent receptor plug domain-containing protein, partial [Vicinamibacterales bacterium]
MRTSTRIAIAVSAALLWSAPGPARAAAMGQPSAAEQQLKQLSLEQLGDIVVTTQTKQPEEVWNTAAAIFVLTQQDIRRSGARTLPELLRLVPGIQVARLDSDHWAVGVRGFASKFSQSLLVLIDGRSVYSPLFAGVYWDVQVVPMQDIDRVEVIRGPGGTIWGANAVNGVINIITKSAQDTQGVSASFGGGDLTHAL